MQAWALHHVQLIVTAGTGTYSVVVGSTHSILLTALFKWQDKHE